MEKAVDTYTLDSQKVEHLILLSKVRYTLEEQEKAKECQEDKNLYEDKAREIILPCLNEELFLVDLAKQELKYNDPFFVGSPDYDPIDYLKYYASEYFPPLMKKLSDEEQIKKCIEEGFPPLSEEEKGYMKNYMFSKQAEEVDICNEAIARDATLKHKIQEIKTRDGGNYVPKIIQKYNLLTNRLFKEYGNSENEFFKKVESNLLDKSKEHYHLRPEVFPLILSISVNNKINAINMSNEEKFEQTCDKAEELVKQAGHGHGYSEELGIGLGEYDYYKSEGNEYMMFEYASPQGENYKASYFKDYDEYEFTQGTIMGNDYEVTPEEWLGSLQTTLGKEKQQQITPEKEEKSLSEKIFNRIDSLKQDDEEESEDIEENNSIGFHR